MTATASEKGTFFMTTIESPTMSRELTELRLSTLALDPEINRAVDDGWVQRLVRDWEPLALQLVSVWRQTDDTLMTIDGQHRKLAASVIGWDEPIAAHVYTGLTLRTAAELFLRINAQRNVNPIDKFRKAVQAEHGTEVAVADLLAGFDLRIGHSAADVSAPVEITRAYGQLGAEELNNVIAMLIEAFPEVKPADALSQEVVASMTNILTRYPRRGEEIDLAHVGEVLAELTFAGLLNQRDMLWKASPQKTKRWHLANAMTKTYNERQTRSKRVSSWPLVA